MLIVLCNLIVLLNYVEKLNCVIENLVGRKKEKKRTNCLFCFTTRDGSGHMGGGYSTCGNGDYERQAMSNGMHDSMREAAS